MRDVEMSEPLDLRLNPCHSFRLTGEDGKGARPFLSQPVCRQSAPKGTLNLHFDRLHRLADKPSPTLRIAYRQTAFRQDLGKQMV